MAYSVSKDVPPIPGKDANFVKRSWRGAMPVGCLLSGVGTTRRSYKMEIDGHG